MLDPTRPVMLNLSQGIAWDGWIGRGVRSGHPEDYAAYLEGCDMASFSIYPIVHSHSDVSGKLWYVSQGAARLREWSHGNRMTWCMIEASRIGSLHFKPTAEQIRAEAWMAIIHGARGIVYFLHQFQPKYHPSPILEDPELFDGVAKVNEEIHSLASVINSPPADAHPLVESSDEDVPIATMLRRRGGDIYLFAVAMRNARTTATFIVPGVDGGDDVEVLGEDRSLEIAGDAFTDEFKGYQAHLYKID